MTEINDEINPTPFLNEILDRIEYNLQMGIREVIIFYGDDKTGKSTLLKFINRKIAIKYFKIRINFYFNDTITENSIKEMFFNDILESLKEENQDKSLKDSSINIRNEIRIFLEKSIRFNLWLDYPDIFNKIIEIIIQVQKKEKKETKIIVFIDGLNNINIKREDLLFNFLQNLTDSFAIEHPIIFLLTISKKQVDRIFSTEEKTATALQFKDRAHFIEMPHPGFLFFNNYVILDDKFKDDDQEKLYMFFTRGSPVLLKKIKSINIDSLIQFFNKRLIKELKEIFDDITLNDLINFFKEPKFIMHELFNTSLLFKNRLEEFGLNQKIIDEKISITRAELISSDFKQGLFFLKIVHSVPYDYLINPKWINIILNEFLDINKLN